MRYGAPVMNRRIPRYSTGLGQGYPMAQQAPPTVLQQQKQNKLLGMGDGGCCDLCAPFASIKPLIHTPEGAYINPLFDYVKVFHLSSTPFPLTLSPSSSIDVSLVNQAEENHFGDLLVSELMATGKPNANRFLVTIKNQQNDRLYMNAPVLDRFVFANSQLCAELPCCFLIQSTNFVQITCEAIEAVDTDVRIVARGTRFLPYQNPELREQLLSYWNQVKTTPYWLTIDLVTPGPGVTAISGGVRIAAGSTANVFMTVPGAGDFQHKRFVTAIYAVPPGGLPDPSDFLIEVKEGIGRSMADGPLPLGDFVAQANKVGVGVGASAFQGGEFRAASGGHCRQPSQFFKRNTRMRISIQNTGIVDADLFLTDIGCMHYYDECPPASGLQRALSLEPTIGPMLMEAPRCPPVASFEPMPGQGFVQSGGAPVLQVPPTGYSMPPQAMSGMGQLPWGGRAGRRVESPDGGWVRRGGSW